MNRILTLLFVILAFFSIQCKKKGCTDSNALNVDYDATKDNGSCKYSTATFYASAGYYYGIPITRIDVSINGSSIGSITSVYPSGPGNCSATGTISYTFKNGDNVDWNSIAYLATGAVVYGSGQTSPANYNECIKVNVTQ